MRNILLHEKIVFTLDKLTIEKKIKKWFVKTNKAYNLFTSGVYIYCYELTKMQCFYKLFIYFLIGIF